MTDSLRKKRCIALFVTLLGVLFLLLNKMFHWNIALPWRWPLKVRFDLNCLGCAATRASNALVRGDISLAWWYHPLWVIAVGVGFLHWLDFCWNALRPRRISLCRWHWNFICRRPVLWAVTVTLLLVGFTILRNLPVYQNFFYA